MTIVLHEHPFASYCWKPLIALYERPHLARYFGQVRARPAVTRVIDEARPYRPLFPLPWPVGID
jgi:hypothetical protein